MDCYSSQLYARRTAFEKQVHTTGQWQPEVLGVKKNFNWLTCTPVLPEDVGVEQALVATTGLKPEPFRFAGVLGTLTCARIAETMSGKEH